MYIKIDGYIRIRTKISNDFLTIFERYLVKFF